MEEKQPFKLRYLFVTFIAFIIALTFYYGQTFEEAIYSEGFPVPGKARIVKVSSVKSFESYSWKPASEENGLPIRYQLIIRLSGWKKVNQVDGMTTYEKEGQKVDIVSRNNHLGIHGQNE
ncbi:hypothetical protein [Sporosarcina sp. JAI121]|uniref:hypothetical protein n=1 Tax=Sporosarcina sp. JAI121 TaxID=2723064 RepID=UPI0015C992F9|nr:hypothetical protein [Sporosarcina sp. JAI121]NYF23286.1 hypothetical protein [Sporosarcina sp. JAI121]